MRLKILSAKWRPFCPGANELTHWGRVTHICVSKLTTIGSANGLSPDRRQAIIWTNAGILLIRTLGINISDFLSEIRAFSFKKMRLKMSSGKWRPSCLGLNVLTRLRPCRIPSRSISVACGGAVWRATGSSQVALYLATPTYGQRTLSTGFVKSLSQSPAVYTILFKLTVEHFLSYGCKSMLWLKR